MLWAHQSSWRLKCMRVVTQQLLIYTHLAYVCSKWLQARRRTLNAQLSFKSTRTSWRVSFLKTLACLNTAGLKHTAFYYDACFRQTYILLTKINKMEARLHLPLYHIKTNILLLPLLLLPPPPPPHHHLPLLPPLFMDLIQLLKEQLLLEAEADNVAEEY